MSRGTVDEGDYDPDETRDYLVWSVPAGQVFHVLPHGGRLDDGVVEWTREFAEDGMELRPCRNGCYDAAGRLTREARELVLAMRQVDAAGESFAAIRKAALGILW